MKGNLTMTAAMRQTVVKSTRLISYCLIAAVFTPLSNFAYTSDDYVQSGLIAQWDGINNADANQLSSIMGDGALPTSPMEWEVL
jgi:hypothetical protein